MRLGIFARTFPGESPLAVLSAARDAGYDCVQWNMACAGLGALPTHIPDATVAAIRAASEARGVAIAAVSATYNMIHPDPSVRETGRAAFAAIATATPAVGTRIVTICTGSRDPQDQWRHHSDNATPEAWADLLTELALILPIAERHDLLIGIEPEIANVVSTPRRARDLLDHLAHPNLGIVLDPANLFETAADHRDGAVIDEAIDLLAGRVVLAHAKDRRADGQVVAAGQGIVDLPRFLSRLQATCFNGPVVTHGLAPEDAPVVARLLRAALPA